jgi:lipopolysaccharide/colanic/teichoic acid biosynthesis glycosyltransferase
MTEYFLSSFKREGKATLGGFGQPGMCPGHKESLKAQVPFRTAHTFLARSSVVMIHYRTKGFLQLRLAFECTAVSALFWVWFLAYVAVVPSAGVTPAAYVPYLAALLGGLFLETLTTDAKKAIGQIQDGIFVSQHPILIRQIWFSVGVLLLFLVLTKDSSISRFFLLSFIPAEYFLLLILHRCSPRLLVPLFFNGEREERVLLVEPSTDGAKLEGWLKSKTILGFRTVGCVRIPCSDRESLDQAARDALADVANLLAEKRATLVILLGWIPPEVCRDLLKTVQRHGIRFLIYNNLAEQLRHPVVSFLDDGHAFFALRNEPLENPFNRVCKRLLDLAIALPSVLLVLPIAALLVRVFQVLQSPGPLVHRQIRAGLQNQRFWLLKFRTMHCGHGELSRQATAEDPRVFPAGRLLRKLSVDELPQFINVLRGEMSVVGPRPHLIEHNEEFAEILADYHFRALVKPGLTGLAQVRGFRGETKSPDDIVARLRCDLAYLENWSLLLELSIILRTFWQLIFPPKTAL